MACFAIDDHVMVVCLFRHVPPLRESAAMNPSYLCLRALAVIAAGFLLTLCSGCMSYDTELGTQMTAEKVTQIKKGITTRAEVEALLGPPTSVTMLGNGKRVMSYHYTGTKGEMHATAMSYVPIVGLFAGGSKASGVVHTQTLQVMLSDAGVVEDYEFSDTSTNTGTNAEGRSVTKPVSMPDTQR